MARPLGAETIVQQLDPFTERLAIDDDCALCRE
jgi:hypothetical protein